MVQGWVRAIGSAGGAFKAVVAENDNTLPQHFVEFLQHMFFGLTWRAIGSEVERFDHLLPATSDIILHRQLTRRLSNVI